MTKNSVWPIVMDENGIIMTANGQHVASVMPGKMRLTGEILCEVYNAGCAPRPSPPHERTMEAVDYINGTSDTFQPEMVKRLEVMAARYERNAKARTGTYDDFGRGASVAYEQASEDIRETLAESAAHGDMLKFSLWHANILLAALVRAPEDASEADWPCDNPSDRACLQSAFTMIRKALGLPSKAAA